MPEQEIKTGAIPTLSMPKRPEEERAESTSAQSPESAAQIGTVPREDANTASASIPTECSSLRHTESRKGTEFKLEKREPWQKRSLGLGAWEEGDAEQEPAAGQARILSKYDTPNVPKAATTEQTHSTQAHSNTPAAAQKVSPQAETQRSAQIEKLKSGAPKVRDLSLATLNRTRYHGTMLDKFVSWLADFIKLLEQRIARMFMRSRRPVDKNSRKNQTADARAKELEQFQVMQALATKHKQSRRARSRAALKGPYIKNS